MLIISGMYSQLGVGCPLSEALINIPLILRLLVAYELIFATSTFTIKVSVLLFYLRVFVTPAMKLAAKLTLAFVVLWTVGNIMQVFLICRPFAATYDTDVPGTCGNQVASFIAIGCFNIVTDVIIIILPIPTVCVSVVAIARIVALTRLDMKANLTGTMIYADFLSAVEPNLAILCVSLPMLRTLKSRMRTKGRYDPSTSRSEGQLDSKKFGDSRHVRLTGDMPAESFAMKTVYAVNPGGDYNATIVKGGASQEHSDDMESPTGSQTELAPSVLSDGHPKQGIIVKTRVETRWSTPYE
ncbi:integral membrane protein [Grosmannia clavigera kw1407]|uniref:Integral membrane protein n=1 Tax=Grosmannia clavigera (strain kw1407 / UAMH 11150) TaxID=655863 RepID=F0X8G3_GROCL|nr:uncharacterized protein CMQ_3268 [Grosmannia clavigera kw1407]EFX05199.1 integral membrane protein [Grosmannia clavigera kw1407]